MFSPDALLAGLWPGGRGVHSVLPALGGGAPPLPRLWQHLRPGGGQDQRLHLRGKDDISSQKKTIVASITAKPPHSFMSLIVNNNGELLGC